MQDNPDVEPEKLLNAHMQTLEGGSSPFLELGRDPALLDIVATVLETQDFKAQQQHCNFSFRVFDVSVQVLMFCQRLLIKLLHLSQLHRPNSPLPSPIVVCVLSGGAF
eukprot:716337-Amphidinium_carterae.1